MVSETSMTFYMSLDKNGKRLREVSDHEGDIQNIVGDKIDSEEDDDLMETIINLKDDLFGQSFYQMPLELIGYRYKLADISEKDILELPFMINGPLQIGSKSS